MLALTARSDFAAPPQRTLQRIELGRLDAEESLRLVEHVAAAGTLPGAVAAHAGRAGRRLAAARRRAHAHRARHAGRRPRRRPATLYGCLMARLDRDSTARDVARLAATIGREFDRTLLDAVGTIEPAALDWGLERLVAGGRRRAGRARPLRVRPLAAAGRRAQLAAKARAARATTGRSRGRCSRTFRTSPPPSPSASRATSSTPASCARPLRHWQQAGRQALGRHALREAAHALRARDRAQRAHARRPRTGAPPSSSCACSPATRSRRARGWNARAAAAIAHHARAELLSAGVDASRGALRRAAARCRRTAPRAGARSRRCRSRSACSRSPRPRTPTRRCCPTPSATVGGALVACGRPAMRSAISPARSSSCDGAPARRARARFGRDPAADRAGPPRAGAGVPRRPRGRALRHRQRDGAAARPPRTPHSPAAVALRGGDRGPHPRRPRGRR